MEVLLLLKYDQGSGSEHVSGTGSIYTQVLIWLHHLRTMDLDLAYTSMATLKILHAQKASQTSTCVQVISRCVPFIQNLQVVKRTISLKYVSAARRCNYFTGPTNKIKYPHSLLRPQKLVTLKFYPVLQLKKHYATDTLFTSELANKHMLAFFTEFLNVGLALFQKYH